jgi:hypothetical protein
MLHAAALCPDLVGQVKIWAAGAEKVHHDAAVSAPAFIWRLFWACGIEVPYAHTVSNLELGFKRAGWRMLSAAAPIEPCDIYLQANEEGILINIGLVVKVGKDFFTGLDGSVVEPYYPKRITRSEVVYFMRCGCKYRNAISSHS